MHIKNSSILRLASSIVVAAALAFGGAAMADPLNVQATMVPKEQIKLDFKDGSGHFVLMVRREGTASGTGLLNEASIVEFGRHDIVPGISGDPSGYLVATKGEGNVAYNSSGPCARSSCRARMANLSSTTTDSGKSFPAQGVSKASKAPESCTSNRPAPPIASSSSMAIWRQLNPEHVYFISREPFRTVAPS
ncbi:hypothetical protein GALL_506230 [mine drainage metagenome]|uniref:Uncharacterized protein n=1 Tax=mine drainage metagenome TaxID=410659 RepID=A0A1J5PR79_9ZZZZ